MAEGSEPGPLKPSTPVELLLLNPIVPKPAVLVLRP
jgi:hypothetical protein